MAWTTQQIAEMVGGELVGPAEVEVAAMAALDDAGVGQLTLIADAQYAQRWSDSRAAAALIDRRIALEAGDGRALIRVDNVDLAAALVLEAMAPPPVCPPQGIHAAATVDPTAEVEATARIGPGCYVGPGAVIAADCVLQANVTVLDQSRIGRGSVLWPGAVVRERCTVGARCTIHANAVIGADGFGYRPAPDGRGLVKVPQIGTVAIGDDVEIGAAACIDRGKFAATVIGAGTKIDNLVQIAHNCRIGQSTVIAGCTGLAGSVTLGDGVQVGGGCDIRDHIIVGDGARVAGGSKVIQDVPPGQSVAGVPAFDARRAYRIYTAFEKLPEMYKDYRRRNKQPDGQ